MGDFEVAGLDFQRLSHGDFASEAAFVRAICRNVLKACTTIPAPADERMCEVARDRQAEWVMDDLFDVVDAEVRAASAYYLETHIHPFFDGNGHTGRALTALVLGEG